MTERRPSLKRRGVTMTARQLQVADALQADGWFVLEADSSLWSDEEAGRVAKALAERMTAEVTDD